MLDIKGAVAVITGGGGGIGESIAKYWVKGGGKVVLHDIVPAGLERVAEDIRKMGGEAATLVGNVTKEEDNAALAKLAIERFTQVQQRCRISRSTCWRKCRSGEFPRPIKLFGGRIGWYRHEIDQWLEQRRGL